MDQRVTQDLPDWVSETEVTRLKHQGYGPIDDDTQVITG